MTLRSNVFVSNAEYANGIKHQELRSLLKIGSCLNTPLEKKATFNYSWTRIDGQDVVTQVTFYPPNSHVPSRVINLKEKNYITLQNWYRMVTSVSEYSGFIEDYEEKERVRDIVKRFEDAAKRHGQMQAAAAMGDVSEDSVYETGKALKTLREELYKELDV